MTLGSLFDGSGSFPMAGLLSGIIPVWASEIEPFPIRVTTKRLPFVKHLGDINKINGSEIEPVDIITFGSPCTDLSIAGKRAGLNAERSGLFFQAVRIIKEMRFATNGKYPRFAVRENVTGAFSSNSGEDFRIVLEEICKIKDSAVSVPEPEKWTKSGEILGNGYSVAYRTFDAQYWGVPQRRKRIYLVADFDGECASKILFESEGLSGYSAKSFRAWQETTRSIADGIETSGGNNQPFVVVEGNGSRPSHHGDGYKESDTMYTLNCTENHAVAYGIGRPAMNQGYNARFSFQIEEEKSPTLVASGTGGIAHPVYSSSKASFFTNAEKEKANTLVATDYKDPPLVSETEYIVRRLTPQECALLQGMPGWWCDDLETENPTESEIDWWLNIFEIHRKAIGKNTKPKSRKQVEKWLKNPYSDSSAYKMWGNGIALPCAFFVLSGISYYAKPENN